MSAAVDSLNAGPDESLRMSLQRAGCALGLDLDSVQGDRLLAYLRLIRKWNRVYNLTAVRDESDMAALHLVDSLAAWLPLRRQIGHGRAGVPRTRVLDVGSGAGLPGVVLAICDPALEVTCVDAVGKKAAFVQQVAASLRLDNLRGMHARVEAITAPHDVVCSRAFASLSDFTRWSRGALAPGGVWMAMKGRRPDDELAALPPDVDVFHVEPLVVPGVQAERCLVWMRPATTAGAP